MEFSGQYLTYDEYRLLGGTLDMMPFNLLEFKARKILDGRTQNRIEQTTQEIKLCINEMIKVLQSYEEYETRDKSITSENTDGYSVSYGGTSSADITTGKETELEDVMQNYLLDSGLLYLGVC